MLRDWVKSQTTIEKMRRGLRKIESLSPCQEPELEARLIELFTKAGKAGLKITRRCFVRQAQQICGHLCPERAVKNAGKKSEYSGFHFSHGCFRGVRRRNGISVRGPTRISQEASCEIFRPLLLSISFNRLLKNSVRSSKRRCNSIVPRLLVILGEQFWCPSESYESPLEHADKLMP